jgi:hypothetical protein
MFITINSRNNTEITVNSDGMLLEKRLINPSAFSDEDGEDESDIDYDARDRRIRNNNSPYIAPQYQYRCFSSIKAYELEEVEYNRIKSILSGLNGDFIKEIVAKVSDEKAKKDMTKSLNALFRIEV